MKTTYQVKVTYNKANTQANKMDRIAANIDKKRQKLADDRRKLAGYWKGDNSDSYQAKMNQWENELSGIVTDLRNIAQTIREVARNTYNADMRAVQVAQQKANKKKRK